ncbi:multicopper oxidase family protein [Paracoccus onubensis]|uniref:Multicopper oxidase family protein n=1 Tax=Paracoccus onubensis TaxID=1675788 RepID=A0A418SP02_9RHOB|nr:multicopper oxidase family protein [Paracoccus onubensis]RJE82686.1 multicopper oxidase family protein [Paracoccus onubensis]
MTDFTRRGLLAASVAATAAAQFPRMGMGQTPKTGPTTRLAATSRVLDINGRAATVWGLEGPSGQGLTLDPGQRFRVDLTNDLPDPTLIHWHGQIPPNKQDGVPDMPMPALKPGETRSYDYAALPGTFWMHAHIPMQEMRLLAAPLIVRSEEDLAADRQEVVMFLHDFAFKSPAEVLEEIAGGHARNGGHHGGMPMEEQPPMSGMDHGRMEVPGTAAKEEHDMPMQGMNMQDMDLNDYDWDAYLANDRTLSDPELVRVERDGRVRLRVINASAATVFWIDTGEIEASLVAVDGHAVEPVTGSRFGLAMGQRLDLDLDLSGAGVWPVLALREGARERTGLILATSEARVTKLDMLAAEAAPAFDVDLAQETRLVALAPLPARKVDRNHMLMLGGSMQPYRWTISGKTWGEHIPVEAQSGERVEITFHNMSMMGHPMHLHGHVFQVVEINGQRISGARRDTVYVPPMAMVTVALDAGEAARWMLHCHHMPHLETGMMTEFAVASA